MRELIGLALTAAALVALLAFIVAGSRPRFAGRPRSARTSWGYLRRYHAVGWAARAAAGLPLGWAVGELAGLAGLSIGASFVAAAVVTGLAWTFAPMLATAVGVLALIAEAASFASLGDDTTWRVVSALGGAVVLGGGALVAFGIGLRNAPLALAAILELVTLSIELGHSVDLAGVLITGGAVLAAVALVSVAPELVLAMLGVALAAGNIAALILLGPEATDDLVVGLAAMAAVLPVAAVLRVLPRPIAL